MSGDLQAPDGAILNDLEGREGPGVGPRRVGQASVSVGSVAAA